MNKQKLLWFISTGIVLLLLAILFIQNFFLTHNTEPLILATPFHSIQVSEAARDNRLFFDINLIPSKSASGWSPNLNDVIFVEIEASSGTWKPTNFYSTYPSTRPAHHLILKGKVRRQGPHWKGHRVTNLRDISSPGWVRQHPPSQWRPYFAQEMLFVHGHYKERQAVYLVLSSYDQKEWGMGDVLLWDPRVKSPVNPVTGRAISMRNPWEANNFGPYTKNKVLIGGEMAAFGEESLLEIAYGFEEYSFPPRINIDGDLGGIQAELTINQTGYLKLKKVTIPESCLRS